MSRHAYMLSASDHVEKMAEFLSVRLLITIYNFQVQSGMRAERHGIDNAAWTVENDDVPLPFIVLKMIPINM